MVYDAVGKVLAEERPTTWKLKAYKYYYLPWKEIGLAGIVIEPTDDLIRYQKKLIDAVAPFTAEKGTAAVMSAMSCSVEPFVVVRIFPFDGSIVYQASLLPKRPRPA